MAPPGRTSHRRWVAAPALLALLAALVGSTLPTRTAAQALYPFPPPKVPGATAPPIEPPPAKGIATIDSSTETVSYIPLQHSGAVVSNQNVPLAYGSSFMNNVATGDTARPRSVMFGSQDNFYQSCTSQATRLIWRGSPCHNTIPALKPFAEGLATAECRVVSLAVKTQRVNIPPDCCPLIRQFVQDGCTCDTSNFIVSPLLNVSATVIMASARAAQVSYCASDEYGGPIVDPCISHTNSCEKYAQLSVTQAPASPALAGRKPGAMPAPGGLVGAKPAAPGGMLSADPLGGGALAGPAKPAAPGGAFNADPLGAGTAGPAKPAAKPGSAAVPLTPAGGANFDPLGAGTQAAAETPVEGGADDPAAQAAADEAEQPQNNKHKKEKKAKKHHGKKEREEAGQEAAVDGEQQAAPPADGATPQPPSRRRLAQAGGGADTVPARPPPAEYSDAAAVAAGLAAPNAAGQGGGGGAPLPGGEVAVEAAPSAGTSVAALVAAEEGMPATGSGTPSTVAAPMPEAGPPSRAPDGGPLAALARAAPAPAGAFPPPATIIPSPGAAPVLKPVVVASAPAPAPVAVAAVKPAAAPAPAKPAAAAGLTFAPAPGAAGTVKPAAAAAPAAAPRAFTIQPGSGGLVQPNRMYGGPADPEANAAWQARQAERAERAANKPALWEKAPAIKSPFGTLVRTAPRPEDYNSLARNLMAPRTRKYLNPWQRKEEKRLQLIADEKAAADAAEYEALVARAKAAGITKPNAPVGGAALASRAAKPAAPGAASAADPLGAGVGGAAAAGAAKPAAAAAPGAVDPADPLGAGIGGAAAACAAKPAAAAAPGAVDPADPLGAGVAAPATPAVGTSPTSFGSMVGAAAAPQAAADGGDGGS